MQYWYTQDYSESRQNFLRRAKELGFGVQSWRHPENGPRGEDLYIDLARGGDLESKKGLLHLIGTHGVEGYAGTAIQNEIFSQIKEYKGTLPRLLFVHPVNPYGMAWLRRTNQNNVDLNRNYRSKDFKAPDTAVYKDLNTFLNPKSRAEFMRGWADFLKAYLKHKKMAVVNGIAQGQYEYPQGLFYGGEENQPEVNFLKSVFADWAGDLETIWAFEVHTGLGAWARDMLIVDRKDPKEVLEETQKVLGYKLTVSGASETSYGMYGQLSDALRESTEAKLHYVLQEFGTLKMLPNLLRARSENYFHHHGDKPADVAAPVKTRFLEVFFPTSIVWRKEIVRRGVHRYMRALEGISEQS